MTESAGPRAVTALVGAADLLSDAGEYEVSAGARVTWSVVSVRGRRSENEDSWAASPPVFVVADGMGGYAAGADASRLVSGAVAPGSGTGTGVTAGDVETRIANAHAQVVERSEELGRTMGSTLTGAALVEAPGGAGAWTWLVFNVGDSRAYVRSQGSVRQVSIDHSVVQELLTHGTIDRSQADRHPERHVVTRALGTTSPHQADYWAWPAYAGDRLLLCSDGLLLVGSEQVVVAGVLTAPNPMATLLDLLTPVAESARDNVTVMLLELIGDFGVMDDETTIPRASVAR